MVMDFWAQAMHAARPLWHPAVLLAQWGRGSMWLMDMAMDAPELTAVGLG